MKSWSNNLLFFSTDEETILLRHNAVAEFTEKEQIFYGLQMVLEKFVDIGILVIYLLYFINARPILNTHYWQTVAQYIYHLIPFAFESRFLHFICGLDS